MMTKLVFAVLLFFAPQLHAAFANYNSILIGERAAGMGGAFTALTDDTAGCSYYNPATLARMEGTSLSATVSAYNKFDTQFGNQDEFNKAAFKINRGSIIPIPSSSGSVHTFRNFALGLSILFPDFDSYNGDVGSSENSNAYVKIRDESLWVGGSLALNVTENTSVGFTSYYTSRKYTRSITNRFEVGGNTTVMNEEKSFSNNSLIYILGLFHRWNENWTTGLSYRLPSIEISGIGAYFRSVVETGSPADEPINLVDVNSNTEIPARFGLGVAYEEKKHLTISTDVSYTDGASYNDFSDPSISERIIHQPIWNVNLGGEYFLKSWLALRLGAFTNFSSHAKIPSETNERLPDHIDMWGWSANFAIYTSPLSRLTLGGYYTGGKGNSTQEIDNEIRKVSKSLQIFSFLVGTAFQF